MIDGLKPYPAYKASVVQWLGEVPEHWEVRRLRNVLKGVSARNRPDLPLLSVVREKGVILRDVTNKDENHNFIPDDLTNYKVVREGQFVMNKMKTWQGSYGVSRHDGIVSPAYFIFDTEGVESAYFHFAIRSKAYVPFFTQASDGVRIGQWDLSQARMKEISFFIPTISEQTAIVRFLNYADRRIRRYISAKEKLIKLLEEQKQAIIHRAVTRGLDPNVRLKPSGVDWLGEVPEHWEVAKIKYSSRKISKGDTPSNFGMDFVENGPVRFIKIEDIGAGELIETPHHTIDFEAHEKITRSQLRENDIVFAISGATTGKSALVRAHHLPANTNQTVAFIRPNTRVLPRYLVVWLHGAGLKDAMWLATVQSAQPNLSMEDLGNLPLLLPPALEQHEILERTDEQQANWDVVIGCAQREIFLLHEYRIRLIADVVTGKLNVREVAARLPDEPELLDEVDVLSDTNEDLNAAPDEAEA